MSSTKTTEKVAAGEDRDRKGALTKAQLVSLAREECRNALDGPGADLCSTLPVKVAPLGGPAGLTSMESRTTWDPNTNTRTSTLKVEKVTFDPILLDTNVEYVRHVAAHEWNHVEEATRSKTPEAYQALTKRADTYFQPRAKVDLTDTTGGLELLTDCMTVFQDGTEAGAGREGVTAYAQQYLTSRDMRTACGSGWEDLLKKK